MSTGCRVLWFADACRIYYVWSAHSAGLDQPGLVANSARIQLNRKHIVSLSPFVPENLVSRDGFGRPIRVSPLILHTWAKSSIWCVLTKFLPFSATASACTINRHGISPESIGSRHCVQFAFTAESPPAQSQ